MPDDSGYLLDNRAAGTGTRLAALAAIFDPTTFRHLDALGLGEGWRCWEVGAGGASVVRWLAQRVGAGGRVVATDVDVAWIDKAVGPNVEVLVHDVGRDAPPVRGFDLVHARLVLVHVARRDQALASMVQALRPGGWLVVEDADPALQPLSSLDPRSAEEELANKLRTGFRALLAERGVDLAYGRKLPRLLRDAGLIDVAADAYLPMAIPECALLEETTIGLVRDQLVGRHVATDAEIDEHLRNVTAGRLDLAQPPMVSAWGRVPA
ncbi:MAG TPA: methyltransferase domain-containing protein [Acidimicrobiales bacterium]